jgi:hypothetical protein
VGNTNGSYNGALDEVQFYNRILSPSEVASLAVRPPQPGLTASLVAPSQSFGLKPTGQYATASKSLYIDPAVTSWVAWNRFPELRGVSDTLPGQLLLGTYTPEVDDHFDLTITNPVGQSLSVAMDRNGVLGAPIGQQSVIYGSASVTPDVVRGDNFGDESFFDEAGAFNSIFTVAGIYSFQFSFQNIGGDAGYPDVYLLTQVVPEPGTIGLGATGLGALVLFARRVNRKRPRKSQLGGRLVAT